MFSDDDDGVSQKHAADGIDFIDIRQLYAVGDCGRRVHTRWVWDDFRFEHDSYKYWKFFVPLALMEIKSSLGF